MDPDQYQMGGTKVFVKNPESVSVYERQTGTCTTCSSGHHVTWGTVPHPCKPQFLHLESGESNSRPAGLG